MTDTGMYITLLVVSIALTFGVGRLLVTAGEPFLQEVFQDEKVTRSVNLLLSVLFHLITLGVLAIKALVLFIVAILYFGGCYGARKRYTVAPARVRTWTIIRTKEIRTTLCTNRAAERETEVAASVEEMAPVAAALTKEAVTRAEAASSDRK